MQKHAELVHLCMKKHLEEKNFQRLNELAQDPQVNLNYTCEDQLNRTPLMLLCSSNNNKLFECVETLLKRGGIHVNLLGLELLNL